MRNFYWWFRGIFLTIVIVAGLTGAVLICKVEAAVAYPQIMLQGVPYYPQKLSGDCGISSIAMIEAYALGYDSSCYDAVYDGVMLANGKSLSIGLAVNNGRYRDISKDLGVIYNELAAGRPVLIYRTGNENHWSVIVGYNGSTSALQKRGFIVYNTMHGRKPGETVIDNLENWLNGYTWSHAKVRSSGAISGITTSVNTLTLEITYPENIKVGNGVAATGLLISTGNITEVYALVKTTGGRECFRTPTERPNSKYYTLLTQDNNMKFGSLSAGSYLYCVYAKDSTGACLEWEQTITVSNSSTSFKKVVSQGTQGTQISPVFDSNIFTSVRAEEVTATSAKITADYVKDTYGDVGFYFGTSAELGAMTRVSEYKYSNIVTTVSLNNSYKVGIYYDDTYQYKWWPALMQGTTYYYAFYCTKDGVEHISGIQSFATIDTEAPVITNVRVTDVDSNGYTVLCDVTDNMGVVRVAFPTWTEANGQDDLDPDWYERCAVFQPIYGNTYSFRVDKSDHNNEYGVYTTHVYAYDATGNSGFAGCGAILSAPDTEAPVITNVRVTDVDGSGYTVLCDVTDNMGVVRVTFPTWTEANGQDDLDPDWYEQCAVFQPAYGNTYSFRVNISNHNNEYGVYYTDIYAYDASGNGGRHTCRVTLQPQQALSGIHTLSGLSKSFGKDFAVTKIQLISSSGIVVASTMTTSNTVGYRLDNISSGTYTLRVSKVDHVTREYSVTITDTNVSQDTEVQLLGDVNGDGVVNARDKKMLYNHIEKISELSGYLFHVGDVNGDGTLNARDKKILYNHIDRIASLWEEE